MSSRDESRRKLGVFAKYWAPGQVKTRLGSEIGAATAADVYRSFLAALDRRLASIDADRAVHFTPPEREADFRELLATSWSLESQSDGDLGQRMRVFFDHAFQIGYQQVILLGSDSPHVPTETLEEAFELLTTCQVVLGPTLDGGYYLVGARQRMPDLFTDIPWSTGQVWNATLARLHAQGYESGRGYAVLPTCLDVDTSHDLEMLLELLDRDPAASDPHLCELRTAVGHACPGLARKR